MIKKALFILSLAILCLHGFSQNLRIVSLAPSLTQMLYLIDGGETLIGCTSYCEQAKKDNKNVVASAVEVNVEKVLLLKPDLVITTTLTKPVTIEALKKVGIKVQVYTMPKSYTEICKQFIDIAGYIGKNSLAYKIVEEQQKRLKLLQKSIPKGKKPKVFFEIGAKPLYTIIPNTFMDDYITFCGGENIAAELKKGSINREYVFLKNPDFIFIVTMGIVGTEEKANWEANRNINASKNGNIFIIDSNKVCSPNPVSFVDVVEQLTLYMYP